MKKSTKSFFSVFGDDVSYLLASLSRKIRSLFKKYSLSPATVISSATLIVLGVGLFAGLVLQSLQQDVRQQAQETSLYSLITCCVNGEEFQMTPTLCNAAGTQGSCAVASPSVEPSASLQPSTTPSVSPNALTSPGIGGLTACDQGQTSCRDGQLRTCLSDSSGWSQAINCRSGLCADATSCAPETISSTVQVNCVEGSCDARGWECVAGVYQDTGECANALRRVGSGPCDVRNTCINGTWCGDDNIFTDVTCERNRSCGDVPIGKCDAYGNRCVDGQLILDPNFECVRTAGLCYYGASSCSALGRYESADCSSCPETISACCGAEIPPEAQVCQPGNYSCAGDLVTSCSLDGTQILQMSCAVGRHCEAGRCVLDTPVEGAETATTESCTCGGGFSSGQRRFPIGYELQTAEGCKRCTDVYDNLGNQSCKMLLVCGISEPGTANPEDNQRIDELQVEFDVTVYGGSEAIPEETVDGLETALELLPPSMTQGVSLMFDRDEESDLGEDSLGFAYHQHDFAEIDSDECERQHPGAADIYCSGLLSTIVHEVTHLNDGRDEGQSDILLGFEEAAANDGVVYQNDINDSYDRGRNTVLMQYGNNQDVSSIEGWATAAEDYVLNPEELRSEFPEIYDYLRSTVFETREYMTYTNSDCSRSIRIKNATNQALSEYNNNSCGRGRSK